MKLKLEIQRFNSTNQTTHYDLSQYTANDKPTYLIDYNGDMAKIDTAIYGADARSLVNESAIGDLTDLDTTAKSDLVSAVNEIKSATDTNTSNIATNTSNISTLGSNQGTMANLTTTDKTSLVGAINEVNAVNQTQNTQIAQNTSDIEKFNLTSYTTYSDTDMTKTGCTVTSGNVTVATNSDGSIFKLYGSFTAKTTSASAGTITIQTSVRPTNGFTVNPAGVTFFEGSTYTTQRPSYFSIDTNGVITFTITNFGGDYTTETKRVILMPCLYFAKDFGDQPE